MISLYHVKKKLTSIEHQDDIYHYNLDHFNYFLQVFNICRCYDKIKLKRSMED